MNSYSRVRDGNRRPAVSQELSSGFPGTQSCFPILFFSSPTFLVHRTPQDRAHSACVLPSACTVRLPTHTTAQRWLIHPRVLKASLQPNYHLPITQVPTTGQRYFKTALLVSKRLDRKDRNSSNPEQAFMWLFELGCFEIQKTFASHFSQIGVHMLYGCFPHPVTDLNSLPRPTHVGVSPPCNTSFYIWYQADVALCRCVDIHLNIKNVQMKLDARSVACKMH